MSAILGVSNFGCLQFWISLIVGVPVAQVDLEWEALERADVCLQDTLEEIRLDQDRVLIVRNDSDSCMSCPR